MTTHQRVALVTGAARGQGWAITQRLRVDGFFVAACDISATELGTAVDGLGDDAVIAIPLYVTSPSGWQEAVAVTADRFGSLTAVVNNAGVLHRASIADESVEGFERRGGSTVWAPSWGSARHSTNCVPPRVQPSSTPAAPARSGPSRTTFRTARRSGRCAA